MTEDDLKAIKERAEQVVAWHEQPVVRLKVTTPDKNWPSQIEFDGRVYLPENETLEALRAENALLRTNLAVECQTTAHLSARIAELEEALQHRHCCRCCLRGVSDGLQCP